MLIEHRTLKKIQGNIDTRKIEYQERIAATLFIYFLNFYGLLYRNGKQVIDNNTLAALTLLIAESNPKEKDVIIDLVMNFLNNE